eukprot:9482506-Pyramimonas_sp.AAC.1
MPSQDPRPPFSAPVLLLRGAFMFDISLRFGSLECVREWGTLGLVNGFLWKRSRVLQTLDMFS